MESEEGRGSEPRWRRESGAPRGQRITGRTPKISGAEGKRNDCIWRFSSPNKSGEKVLVYGTFFTERNCLFLCGWRPDYSHVDRKPKYAERITIRVRNYQEKSEIKYSNSLNCFTERASVEDRAPSNCQWVCCKQLVSCNLVQL